MTECERLIKENKIPSHFLTEEVRDGILVDKNRKKLWAVLLDLLSELDLVCKKHGLKYSLYAGTLLGAVRHKGFIPWDDDVDVAMLREDYDKLKSLAYEFKTPYFLQYPHTDPEAGYSHIKIRNSNTTAFNKIWSYRKYNFGIYIDIFPIDNFHEEGQWERLEKVQELNVDNSLYMKMPSPYANEWDKYRFSAHSGKSVVENYDEIERIATLYKDEKTEKVIRATAYAPIERIVWQRSMWTELIDLPFEDRCFPAPKAWDAYLRQEFGNYWEFPPIDKRVNKHEHTVFEPDIPYLEYQFPEYQPYTAYLEYGKRRLAQEMEQKAKHEMNGASDS